MLDANGFISSGILDGSFSSFGDFDECLQITQKTSNIDITGQYCMIKFNFEVPSNRTRLTAKDVVFNTSGTILEDTVCA